MDAVHQEYKYKISMSYVLANNEYKITDTMIKSITADYNYDVNNKPVVYTSIAITNTIYHLMDENRGKGYVSLVIQKQQESKTAVAIDYIKGRFSYFILEESEDTEEANGSGKNTSPYGGDEYRNVDLALINIDNINNSKKTYNTVLNGVTLMDAVHYGTAHLPLIVEPVNGGSFSSLIIPPISSTTKYLEYINSIKELYNTPYRFFMDFTKSYLLSSSGKGVPAKGELVNSIIITEKESVASNDLYNGQEYDASKKVYNLIVSEKDVETSSNETINKTISKVVGISSTGAKTESAVSSINDEFSTDKTLFIRVSNDNSASVSALSKRIGTKSITINFNKCKIDNAIIEPNMTYHFDGTVLKDYRSGSYILSRKIELYKRTGDEYLCDMNVSLRKIMS